MKNPFARWFKKKPVQPPAIPFLPSKGYWYIPKGMNNYRPDTATLKSMADAQTNASPRNDDSLLNAVIFAEVIQELETPAQSFDPIPDSTPSIPDAPSQDFSSGGGDTSGSGAGGGW